MKVNCDVISFTMVGWIAGYVIIILLIMKNFNILNKTTINLACYLFHNQIVIENLEICSN